MICRKKPSWPCSNSTTISAERPSEPLYLATKNAGKLAEFAQLLVASRFEPCSFAAYVDPVEGETSYADNAALKARALRVQLERAGIHAAVLADDSGMEVAALDGRPGVVTAYYGGTALTWAERRRFVLAELARHGASDRTARFVCYLHYIGSRGDERAVHASVDGSIALFDRGRAGFSFDPIFVYGEEDGRTFAELTLGEKNSISHRSRAVSALLAQIALS